MKRKLIKAIRSNSANYTINVQSNLDGFNTVDYIKTDNAKNIQEVVKFEPNISLTLENIGDTIIHNPKIVVNNRRRWFSAEDILTGIVDKGMTDEEVAISLYKFFSSVSINAHNNYHRVDEQFPLSEYTPSHNSFQERANPVKAVNIYYVSGCISTCTNFVILARYFGLDARVLIACPINGPYDRHAVVEVFYNGKYHLFDPEARIFFLKKDNVTIASYEELHRQPELAFRTHGHGFAALNNYAPFINLYKSFYPPYQLPVENWLSTIQIDLRPNEKLVYNWSEIGKFRYGNNPRNVPVKPYKLSNGLLIYEPSLKDNNYRKAILSESNIHSFKDSACEPNLHILSPIQPAHIIFQMSNFYPIVGGQVKIEYYKKDTTSDISLFLGNASQEWIWVWSGDEIGVNIANISLDEHINAVRRKAIRKLYLKFVLGTKMDGINVGINMLQIICNLQMANSALPSLSKGANSIRYVNDNLKKTAIRITHEWQESKEFEIPETIKEVTFPSNLATVSIEALKLFKWQYSNLESIQTFHIFISQRSDLLIPISPNFDRLTFNNRCEFTSPVSFWRNGCTYYWRVRAQSKDGVWSEWSQTWTFQTTSE